MYWLKACPKCGGDLYEGTDMFGPYVACLQCARYLSDAERVLDERPSPRRNLRDAVPVDVAERAA